MEGCRVCRLLVVSAVAVAALACGPAVQDYRVVRAPSGRALRVEAVSAIDAGGEPALLLVYHSDVDLSDARALRAEVDDAWRWLRPRAEAEGHRAAVIRATQWERRGWARRGRATEFVVVRTDSGAWKLADGAGS